MNYGRLMLDVVGLELTDAERETLKNPHVGGLILFARNYQSKQQLTDLIHDVRRQNPHIIVAVDQEGGRVQRFREGFTVLPAMQKLAISYQRDSDLAALQATELGWLMAAELIQVGVDISLAPVLDLHWNHSQVIGNRAFGDSAEQVSLLASCFMQGMQQAGMQATGKHFPGHGWAVADSHLEAAVDERSFEQIAKDDLQPFIALIKQGLAAVMPAHVIYSNVDDKPAGYSSHWLKAVLREQLAFDGVIFSDDLDMEGAQIDSDFARQLPYAARAQAAIQAGCDTVLVCNNPEAAQQVLDYLATRDIPGSPRLKQMRARAREVDQERWQRALIFARELCELSD